MEISGERLFRGSDDAALQKMIEWAEFQVANVSERNLAKWGLPRLYAEMEFRVNERLLQWVTKGGAGQ